MDMEDWNGNWYWAEYSNFSVGSDTDKYKLHVSGFDPCSTAGDSLLGSTITNADTEWRLVDGMAFSTIDIDNDKGPFSCAISKRAGWWFNNCLYALPTGEYINHEYIGTTGGGVNWFATFGNYYSFKKMSMSLISQK